MKNRRFNDMMTCLHGYRVCGDKLNYILENLMMYGEDVTLKDIVNDLERQQSVLMKDAMEAFQGNDEVGKKLFKDLKPGDSFYYYRSGSIDSLHKVKVKGIHKDDLRNEVIIAAEFPEGEVILRYNSSLWNKHTHTETLDNQNYFDIVSTDKEEFMDMMRKLTGHSTWKLYLKKMNDMEEPNSNEISIDLNEIAKENKLEVVRFLDKKGGIGLKSAKNIVDYFVDEKMDLNILNDEDTIKKYADEVWDYIIDEFNKMSSN